jgi:hypothetical protein
MPRKIAIGLLCLALLPAAAIAGSHAEKPAAESAGQPPMSPEMQAEMEAWMKLHVPGEEHQQLAAAAGTWKASGKSYMGGPEPVTFQGTSQRALILGGRVLTDDFKAEMMGMPFEGHGLTGYDNATKRWWTTWNDSMSTSVMVAYGKWDDAAKGVVFDSEIIDPKGQPIKVRLVSRHPGATQEEFEYWEERGGKLTKTMEMTLTKQ